MKKIFLFALSGLLLVGCGHKNSEAAKPATLDDINRALQVVSMRSGGQFPPDTNEVTKFLTMWGKTMPVPPSGKKLVLDSVKRQFVFADQ